MCRGILLFDHKDICNREFRSVLALNVAEVYLEILIIIRTTLGIALLHRLEVCKDLIFICIGNLYIAYIAILEDNLVVLGETIVKIPLQTLLEGAANELRIVPGSDIAVALVAEVLALRKVDTVGSTFFRARHNEIWVSDITYVETEEGVCYLSLITDAYSHKIVGWSLGPTLETAYPLKALRMALSGIDAGTARGLIHHSDRGGQYCSDAYVSELRKWGIRISMTQSGDPLENAVAERANGILKSEWLYKMSIPDRATCKAELARIIDFYNTQRPHMSIGWLPATKKDDSRLPASCQRKQYV